MPDDRLFHKRLGHSMKVNQLTDIEEIAWHTYVHAADDFGVMRFTALSLMDHHDRLAKRSMATVQRMLERVRDVGLIVTFEHQARLYCCQLDWQDYQKVRYPLRTANPKIPDVLLARCSRSTRWLFTAWPGGKKKLATWLPPESFEPGGSGSWNGSGNLPGIFPETVRETVRENSRRSRAGDPDPLPDPLPDPGTSQGRTYSPEDLRTSTEDLPPLRVGAFTPHESETENGHPEAPGRVAAALRDHAGAARLGPDDRPRGVDGAGQGPPRAIGFRLPVAAAAVDGRDGRGGARAVEAARPAAAAGADSPAVPLAGAGGPPPSGSPVAAAIGSAAVDVDSPSPGEPEGLTRLRRIVRELTS